MKRINGDLTRDISAGIAWCERQQRNTEDEKYNTMVDTKGMKNKLNSTHKTAVKSTDITETQIMEIDASGTMEERCQRILKQHPLLVFIKGTSNAPQVRTSRCCFDVSVLIAIMLSVRFLKNDNTTNSRQESLFWLLQYTDKRRHSTRSKASQ